MQNLRLTNRQSGFTIIELLIVIVVITILAGLVLTAFNGVQERARDTERRTDINSVHTQLQVYFTDVGQYPTNSEMTATAVSGADDDVSAQATLLEPIAEDALLDPDGDGINVNADDAENYTYVALGTGGAACDNSTTECTDYTLSVELEEDGTDYVKENVQ